MNILSNGTAKGIASKYQMLWRLLLTIIVLICVPMMIVIWLTFNNIYTKMEDQNREALSRETARLADYFSAQQKEMRSVMQSMQFDKELMPDTVNEQNYNVLTAISRIRRYSRMVPLAEDMYVYYRSSNYILSSSSCFRRIYFSKQFNGYRAQNSEMNEKISSVLDSDDKQTKYIAINDPADSQSSGVLVCMPGRMKESGDTVVMFHINPASLKAAYFGQSENGGREISIFKGEQLLITTAGEIELTQSEEFMNLLSEQVSGVVDICCGDENFCVAVQYVSSTGLSFVISVPLEQVNGEENGIRRLVITMTVVSAIAMILLTVVTVYINYRPIISALKKVSVKRGGARERGELDEILGTLDEAVDLNEKMSREITERDAMICDFAMQRLLSGKSISDADINVIRIPRENARFAVVTLIIENKADISENVREDLLPSISEDSGCRVLMTQSFFDGQMIFLIVDENDTLSDELAGEIAGEILNFALANGLKRLRAGVGTIEHSLRDTRSSYLSSVIAADQGADRSVSFYEKTVREFSTLENYPSEKMLLFMQHLKQGNSQNALYALDEVFMHVSRNISSWMLERFVFNDIVNMFVKTVSEIGQPLSNDEVAKLLAFSNADELQRLMLEMTGRVCENVCREREENNSQMTEKIIEYIDANCLNQDISLEMAADHFGMSIYNFSTMFKRAVGCGFREYIVKKRLDCARELLVSTDMAVKNIAADVGFGDVSYFIRVFKNNFGVTPTQMRAGK